MSALQIILLGVAAISNAMVSFFLKKAAQQTHFILNWNFLYAMGLGTLAILSIVIVYKSKINMGQAVLYLTLATLLFAVCIDFFILKNSLKSWDIALLIFISAWLGLRMAF